MENIELNYRDIQFLAGLNEAEAKVALFNALGKEEIEELELETASDVKLKMKVAPSSLLLTMNSPFEEFHKKQTIPFVIERLRDMGIPSSMRRDILEDINCVMREDLCGKYKTLKKILSIEAIEDLIETLKGRKRAHLKSENKVPKTLKKHIKLED